MRPSPRWKWGRLGAAALGVVLFGTVLPRGAGAECGSLDLNQLQRMSPCEMGRLFAQAEVGTPLVGPARGRLLCLTDGRFRRVKVRLSNALWRGKSASEDGHFVNRWIGGIEAIESCYVVGPSWIDGRPAIIMEYPPGTAVFENTHDELRQVGPGLYLGPLYDRFPCPKFRGYIALQLEGCR